MKVRNVLAAISCMVLLAGPLSAATITGTQYTYQSTAGTPAGSGGASESAFMGGVYSGTDISSCVLTDGYITTQDDVNANPAFAVPAYTVGNGPAGAPAIYGVYAGPDIIFALNGSYNLSSMVIGYTVKTVYGVTGPTSVIISANGGSVLQTYSGFDNSVETYPNGDARTYTVDLTSLNLTGVQTVALSFPSTAEWTAINEIQFFGEVPEPTTMALIGMGGLAMLRRRR